MHPVGPLPTVLNFLHARTDRVDSCVVAEHRDQCSGLGKDSGHSQGVEGCPLLGRLRLEYCRAIFIMDHVCITLYLT